MQLQKNEKKTEAQFSFSLKSRISICNLNPVKVKTTINFYVLLSASQAVFVSLSVQTIGANKIIFLHFCKPPQRPERM